MEGILELKKEDAKYLSQVAELRYLVQYEEEGVDVAQLELDKDVLLQNIKDYINRHIGNDLYVFAYIKDDEAVSIASLIIHGYYPDYKNLKGLKGTVSHVFTRENHRRKGYQKQVLEALISKAKELEIPALRVNSNNPVAVEMYQKFGFKKSNNNYKRSL